MSLVRFRLRPPSLKCAFIALDKGFFMGNLIYRVVLKIGSLIYRVVLKIGSLIYRVGELREK